MKLPKKSPKEPSLPTQDESRRTNVLLEKLTSEFRIFGESLSDVRDRVGRVETKIDKHGEDIDVLKSAVRSNAQEIRSLKEAVQGNTVAIQGNTVAIQGNTKDIRDIREDLKKFNRRLEVVETKIAS